MTTPTHEHEQGVNVTVRPSIVGLSVGADRELLNEELDSYTHVINAMGGYWLASFSLRENQENIEEWLRSGLGMHVDVYNDHLVKAWEGFVNQVSITLGDLTVSRGPLVSIANRVRLVYSTVDTSTTPPTVGVRATTALADDTGSQTSYGIIEKVLSAGGVAAAEADQIRDTYLEENRDPKTIQRLGEGQEQKIVVQCLGYVHWLKLYTFTSTTSGDQNLSAKIGDILDADPNSIFASTNARITANTLQVPQYDNDNRTAWAIIKSLVAQGDANDDRYLFGVYDDREVVYDAMPTSVEYRRALADPRRRIIGASDQEVRPWDTRPGEWLFFPDFLVGHIEPTQRRLDPRYLFIESVNFSVPYRLAIQGSQVQSLPQKLAQLGLGGIGA